MYGSLRFLFTGSLLVGPLAACGDDKAGTDTETTQSSTTDGTGSTTDDSTTAGPTTDDTSTSSGTTGTTTPDPTTGTPGTTDGTSTGTGTMLSHAADIQPIWNANCVTGCHTAGGVASAWFLLTDDVAYSSLVGAVSTSFPALTRVIAGNSAHSYLMHKLNGTQGDVGGGGSPMPQPAAMQAFMPLSDTDLEKIEMWIDQGAMP